MLTKGVRFAALGLAALACGGCRISSFSLSVHDDGYRHHRSGHVARVYTHVDHVCSHDCNDHYWNGSHVVVISGGHHHGPGCGHHWSGARWTIVAKHRIKHGHHGGSHIKIKKIKKVKKFKHRHP